MPNMLESRNHMKLTKFLSLPLILPFAILALYGATAHAETVKDGVPRYVETNLIPEFNSITAGQNLTFAVTQHHVEGWHTYWKNPGDSGEATSIQWTMPDGFTAGEILYPAPEREVTGPLVNFGFGEDITLLTTLSVPQNITGDTIHLNAKVTWLVCSDICVPETKDFSFDLPVGKPTTATNPDLFKTARASMPEQKPWQASIEEQDQSILFKFMMDTDEAKNISTAKDIFFFPEDWGILLNASAQESSVTDNTLMIKAARDTRPLSDVTTLKGVITYNDASGQHHAVSVTIPVSANTANIPSPLRGEDSGGGDKTPNTTPPSFAQAIFLALLGGLILNLMPCVFPVLSMKALSLVKMSDREQKHANLHGIFYTLGVMACFGIIAGTLIALQTAGQQIGWGFQLQNPVVVLLLAYLLFAMALNLSGFFEMKGHLFTNIGHKLAAKHGYTGTFFTGMLATIVATPCTAPFMATAMGYALTQPPMVSLTVFMALGLGLSLPYLLLCFIPPLRKSLPKPGAWMETFRQFMSFPLFASVAWLIWVYAQQVAGMYGTLLGLSGLLLIAFSIWVSRHEPRRQPLKTALHALSISAILLALMIAGLSHTGHKTDEKSNTSTAIPQIAYTKDSFDKLLAGDKALFVDMTASWCITCQVNERLAIYTDATQSLFKDKDIQYVVGDWTNKNPEITEFLKTYGRNGVPLYVFYGARDPQTGTRPEPKILPQLLTSGLVADAINGPE